MILRGGLARLDTWSWCSSDNAAPASVCQTITAICRELA